MWWMLRAYQVPDSPSSSQVPVLRWLMTAVHPALRMLDLEITGQHAATGDTYLEVVGALENFAEFVQQIRLVAQQSLCDAFDPWYEVRNSRWGRPVPH